MRIKSITLNNFKAIDNANINILDNITGIYGENGVGKTTALEALVLLSNDFKGSIDLTSDVNKYITYFNDSIEKHLKKGTDYIKVDIEFQIDNYIYTFSKKIKFNQDNKIIIESISYYNIAKKAKVYEVYNRVYDTSKVSTAFSYMLLGEEININIDNLDSISFTKLTSSITILGTILGNTLKNNHIDNIATFFNAIEQLSFIDVKSQAITNLGLIIPMHIHDKQSHELFLIKQFNDYYNEEMINLLNLVVKEINKFLTPLLNKRKIVLSIHKERLTQEGILEQSIRLDVVQPNGEVINIENESTGIVKLISIFSSISEVIKNENYILLIDELDSHVYEYLLALLISNLSSKIKGTLIFTSHNLTLFERLNKNSIVISQKNKQGIVEFVRFQAVSNTTNLRSVYLRELLLGGKSINETDIDEGEIQELLTLISYGIDDE